MPPVPPGFAIRFVNKGWRSVERAYGASTPVNNKWIEACGGRALRAERAKVQRCGRKAGGMAARGREGE